MLPLAELQVSIHFLTLLPSKQTKLHRVLAVLSAIMASNENGNFAMQGQRRLISLCIWMCILIIFSFSIYTLNTGDSKQKSRDSGLLELTDFSNYCTHKNVLFYYPTPINDTLFELPF